MNRSSKISGILLWMAIHDFICLDCQKPFEIDSTKPIEGTGPRCPHCESGHVRQTFESYLRSALAGGHRRSLDELRSCHFG